MTVLEAGSHAQQGMHSKGCSAGLGDPGTHLTVTQKPVLTWLKAQQVLGIAQHLLH